MMNSGPHADVFTVAILKGAIEDEPEKHFGSTLALREHMRTAEDHDLINEIGEPTEKAQDFYERYRLASLPDGRAYLAWFAHGDLIRAILNELNGFGTTSGFGGAP